MNYGRPLVDTLTIIKVSITFVFLATMEIFLNWWNIIEDTINLSLFYNL